MWPLKSTEKHGDIEFRLLFSSQVIVFSCCICSNRILSWCLNFVSDLPLALLYSLNYQKICYHFDCQPVHGKLKYGATDALHNVMITNQWY